MKPQFNEIHIRPAVPGDAETIHALLSEMSTAMSREGEFKATVDDLNRFGFGENVRYWSLLAFAGDIPVGLIIYFLEFSSWNGHPGVYVQDLYVASTVRGSGLGKRLLQSVAARASRLDARYMRLSVFTDKTFASGFYAALGFEPANDELLFKLKQESFESFRKNWDA